MSRFALRMSSWLAGGLCLWHAAVCLGEAKPAVFPGANWTEKTPAQVGMDVTKLDALRSNLCGAKPESSAGCVIKDGYLIYTWGAFTNRHNWASASKPGLSTMLFTAIAEGKVKGPDSLILPYWPGLRPSDQTMTFRHLADMMSGYACADTNKDGKPLPPGSRWSYNDYGIQLYARTLDKIFGGDGGLASGVVTGLVTAAHDRISAPLQFQDVELFEKNKGRLVPSPRDFARLGWLWLNHGKWQDKQLVPASFFEKYLKADVALGTPSSPAKKKPPYDDYLGIKSYGGGVNLGDGQGIYGFNWWYNRVLTATPRNPPLLAWPSAPADLFMALGRAGKDGMVIFPSQGLVVAAYNEAEPNWGDAVVNDPADPADVMNGNLKLLMEAMRGPGSKASP